MISNCRPRRWPAYFLIGSLLTLFLLCVVVNPVVVVAATMALGILLWTMTTGPPEWRAETVGMAELLSVLPANKHFAPEAIELFVFEQDAHEDYTEEGGPLCRLSIEFVDARSCVSPSLPRTHSGRFSGPRRRAWRSRTSTMFGVGS